VLEKAKEIGLYLLVGTLPILLFLLVQRPSDLTSNRAIVYFLIYVPYGGLLLTAVLGWQINQTRVFWSALLLLGIYHFLLHPDLFMPSEALKYPEMMARLKTRSFEIISAAFPLALCIIFLLKESRLWSDQSLSRFLLTLFPFLLFTCLAAWMPGPFLKVFYWGTPSPKLFKIPDLAWATTALFLLAAIGIHDLKIKPFLLALSAAFVPFFLIIHVCLQSIGPASKIPALFHVIIAFTTITGILLFSILHLYWKKVYVDVLTGIPNRQAMDEQLHTLTGEYALAMVDIDYFKKFNDTYGHAEGDNVLRMVAQHLEEHLGARAYRYGGEEFCVIFEGSDAPKAVDMMDETRADLQKRKFILRRNKRRKGEPENSSSKKEDKGKTVHITFSVGVAMAQRNTVNYEEVIKRADRALYQAKDNGRNCVVAEK
jgi:diguanylate cyclase (GGDEF)-like protein